MRAGEGDFWASPEQEEKVSGHEEKDARLKRQHPGWDSCRFNVFPCYTIFSSCSATAGAHTFRNLFELKDQLSRMALAFGLPVY